VWEGQVEINSLAARRCWPRSNCKFANV